MNRRKFLTTTAAAGAVALFGAGSASAAPHVAYSQAKLDSLMAAGTPVLLDFWASWCPTCRAQERVVNSLITNPAYRDIVIMRVDWDQHRRSEISRQLGVFRQSTLILMKSNKEVGRLIAQTSEGAIRGLLDRAAGAA